jgi:hypothetical protein
MARLTYFMHVWLVGVCLWCVTAVASLDEAKGVRQEGRDDGGAIYRLGVGLVEHNHILVRERGGGWLVTLRGCGGGGGGSNASSRYHLV